MADQRRPKVTETAIVRWFCYVCFAVCSILLIVSLTLGWDWRAPLVGSLLYGIPALIMYRQEAVSRENLEVVRGAQASLSRSSGNFEDSFTESDDPTQPPMRKN